MSKIVSLSDLEKTQSQSATKRTAGRQLSLEELKESTKNLKPHKKQSLFIKAKQFIRMWLSARRTGKTTCIILDNLETIKNVAPHTKGHLLKVYPTADKGVELIFDEIVSVLDRLSYLRYESISKQKIIAINQCHIEFIGLRNFRDAEKIRGFKNKSIDFDECQSMISDVLNYAIASPSIQSLSDFLPFGSHLNMYGTPPPSIGHVFAEKFLEKNPEIFKITALMEDNPYYPAKSREMVKREMRNYLQIPHDLPESQITNAFYRREILGQCINDPHRIIFNKDNFKNYIYSKDQSIKDNDRFYVGIYISKFGKIAVSVNKANQQSSKVYLIYEMQDDYFSISQVKTIIHFIQTKFQIGQNKMQIVIYYPRISKELTYLLSNYYNITTAESEEFEKGLISLLAEKININLLLQNFKVKSDSLFLKDCDKVIWNEERIDLDDSVQSPIVYSQLLSWGEINNKFPTQEKIKKILDPAEIFREKLHKKLMRTVA